MASLPPNYDLQPILRASATSNKNLGLLMAPKTASSNRALTAEGKVHSIHSIVKGIQDDMYNIKYNLTNLPPFPKSKL